MPLHKKDKLAKMIKGQGNKSPFSRTVGRGKKMPIGAARERIADSVGATPAEIKEFLKGFGKQPKGIEKLHEGQLRRAEREKDSTRLRGRARRR